MAYFQLIRLGVHIGHTYKNTVLYASWLIYGFRQDIAVINLYKFINMFRIGLSCLDAAVFKFSPIWFANQNRNYSKFIEYFSFKCGEFSSTKYWIRGMLSNYWVICDSFRNITLKADVVKSRKNILFNYNFKRWHLTRFSWPGAIFISSVKNSYFATAEAVFANVPCLGIVDTNSLSQSCTIAIPGNDDSLDCIIFYNDLVSEYILFRKFSYVFLWFINTRKAKRLVSFNDWFSTKFNLNNLFLNNKNYLNCFSTFSLNDISLKLFFSRNIWLNKVVNFLKLISPVSFDAIKVIEGFQSAQSRYSFCFNHLVFRRLSYFRKFFLRNRRNRWKLQNKKLFSKLSRFKSRFFWKIPYLRRFFRFRLCRKRIRNFFKIFLHFYFITLFFKYGYLQLMDTIELLKCWTNFRRGFFLLSLTSISRRRFRTFTSSILNSRSFFFEEKSFKDFISNRRFISFVFNKQRRNRNFKRRVKFSLRKQGFLFRSFKPSFLWKFKSWSFFVNFSIYKKAVKRNFWGNRLVDYSFFKRVFPFRTFYGNFTNFYSGVRPLDRHKKKSLVWNVDERFVV